MFNILNLSKSYDNLKVLDNISIDFYKNNICALIGPNGIGKTTFLKLLSGILLPDKGYIKYNDIDLLKDSLPKEKIAFIYDDMGYINEFTPKVYYEFMKNNYLNWDSERLNNFIDYFDIPVNKKISEFSKGMKNMFSLSIGFSIKPDFYILDEPLAGINPIFRREILRFILKEKNERGCGIVIATHILNEIEKISDRITVLYNRSIIIDESKDDIKKNILCIRINKKNELPLWIKNKEEILDIYEENEWFYIIYSKESGFESKISSEDVGVIENIDINFDDIFIAKMKKEGYKIDGIEI